jgi:hypothetical protein
MSDILEFGISQIEKLELKRAPFKSFHVIYIIKACSDSLDKLFEDFG